MAKSVKLADIAAILNVSTVTVSKALSDQKGVSEEMREKIKKLAQEMGYQSPSAARMMRNKKSFNIGVIISDRYFDQHDSFYWQVYQEIATRAVSKDSFTMLEILGQESEKNLEMPKLLQENKVDGLIIIGLLKGAYLAAVQTYCKVPFVCLDFYDKKHECDAVVTDNFYGMYQLTNYLFDMGHTRIAYVGTLLYSNSITDRYFGYCKALLEHGQKAREDWIIGDRDMETGDQGKLMDFEFRLPDDMPTAFACNCDLTAGLLITELRKKGYRVPEDISIVGFDNYIHPSICDVKITTYEVDIREMVKKAIGHLMKKMSGEHYKQGLTIVEGHMVIKESVKKLTADG